MANSFNRSGGAPGTPGDDGAPGSVLRTGVGAPDNALGINGDYYLNSTNGDLYFKAAGTYTVVANIKGAPGTAGSNGTNGADGKTILNGVTAPSNGLGVNGDFYIDTVLNKIHGPKASGVWPAGVSLVGPTGPSGVLAATAPLAYDSGTQTVSMPKATAAQDGYLDNDDFATFNAKEPAITAGTSSQYLKGDKSLGTFATDVDARITAQKGQASGLATLDGTSKIPSAQLPSYVDDVLEFANLAAFPGTGETGKIYVTLDTNLIYRWTGSVYVNISSDSGITQLTGDVTTSAGSGSQASTIANDAVTNAKAANMATQTIKGRTTAGTGDPEDLTATQATAILNAFVGDSGSGGTKGLVPAPASGDAAAKKFLKASGSFVQPDTNDLITTTNTQIGTSYTLLASDNGKVITLSNASAITLTVPTGLGAGFSCMIMQLGAGQVTITASSTTLRSKNGLKTSGQYAVASIYAFISNNFVIGGDVAA